MHLAFSHIHRRDEVKLSGTLLLLHDPIVELLFGRSIVGLLLDGFELGGLVTGRIGLRGASLLVNNLRLLSGGWSCMGVFLFLPPAATPLLDRCWLGSTPWRGH